MIKTAAQVKIIKEIHKNIIDTIQEYAFLSREWEPAKEGDFGDFSDAILDELCTLANVLTEK